MKKIFIVDNWAYYTMKNKTLKAILFIAAVVLMLLAMLFQLLISSYDIKKLDNYLYSIKSTRYNFSIANMVCHIGISGGEGGCSTIRKDNLVGRNFDWTYGDEADFVVYTDGDEERYASVGVSSLHGIKNSVAEKRLFSLKYYMLPFYTVDGINEKGVFVCQNEVPGEDIEPTTGTNPGKDKLCSAIAVRYILDYAGSVDEAVRLLNDKDIFALKMNGETYEVHLMVADKFKTAVIEFINNKMVVTYDKPYMTNFYLSLPDYTEHSEGIERYNIIEEKYEELKSTQDMKNLLKDLYFSNLYNPDTDPVWYSEMYGDHHNIYAEEFVYSSDIEKFPDVFEEEREGYDSRERNGEFWCTVHTSIYDLNSTSLNVCAQESGHYNYNYLYSRSATEISVENSKESARIIIPIEFCCIWILLIVLYGLVFENSIIDPKTKAFIIMVLLTIFAVFCDLLAWMSDGMESRASLQMFANYFSMIMSDVIPVPFIFYLYEYLKELKNKVKIIPALFALAANAVVIAYLTYETVRGNTFQVENGVYLIGDKYAVCVYTAFADLLIIFAIIVKNYKILGRHDSFAFAVYGIIPLITTMYEFVNPNFQLAFPAVCFSELLLYILLQSGKTAQLQIRQDVLQELCTSDQLTGLYNRRAYDDAIMSGKYSYRTGVFFCDVNSLKHTNDTYGHSAGDDLLVRFSDLLRDIFEYENIYRISGDEFVIFVPDISEKEYVDMKLRFQKVLQGNDDVASVGCVYCDDGDIGTRLSMAETEMYKAKKEYYKRNPHLERRKA